MMKVDLGNLERFEQLREVWPNEAMDFTPWLASISGLKLLGSAIGMELEIDKTEKSVGAFSADIFAKRTDTIDDHYVIIENQLERTDHLHLGQLLTYAAGLDVKTIIWVSSKIRDEHRAALDWLNENTIQKFEFYGLEMELWRIGNSPLAPKFNIICRPNDWQRATKENATSSASGSSQAGQKQLAYWTQLHEKLQQPGHAVVPQKAQPQPWSTFTLGRNGALLYATMSLQKGTLSVICNLSGAAHKIWFQQLEAQKSKIQSEIAGQLEWRELPGKKSSQIRLVRQGVDVGQEANWPDQHKWLADTLDQFSKAFRGRIATLTDAEAPVDIELPTISDSE